MITPMLAGVVLLVFVQSATASSPPEASGEAQAGSEYRLGPDDVLRVTVFGHPDLAQEVVVGPDGTLDFPLIGKIAATDRLPTELEAAIAERLSQGFVREPQVRVVVITYRSKVVFVMGELSRPGSYPLSQGRSVVEVLARAGPLLPSAGNEVLVLRPRAPGSAAGAVPPSIGEAAGASEVMRIDLDGLRSELMAHNLMLQPGDTVFVPKAARVFVSGEVRQPGAYAVQGQTTVRQAITLAGGFAKHAVREKVRVLRQAEGRTADLEIGLEDVVQPGDTLVIGKKRGLF